MNPVITGHCCSDGLSGKGHCLVCLVMISDVAASGAADSGVLISPPSGRARGSPGVADRPTPCTHHGGGGHLIEVVSALNSSAGGIKRPTPARACTARAWLIPPGDGARPGPAPLTQARGGGSDRAVWRWPGRDPRPVPPPGPGRTLGTARGPGATALACCSSASAAGTRPPGTDRIR